MSFPFGHPLPTNGQSTPVVVAVALLRCVFFPVRVRYMEGSKLWTTITVCSRNLAQIVSSPSANRHSDLDSSVGYSHQIWIHVPSEREEWESKTGHPKTQLEIIIEKKSMIKLVQAVSVAIKASATLIIPTNLLLNGFLLSTCFAASLAFTTRTYTLLSASSLVTPLRSHRRS